MKRRMLALLLVLAMLLPMIPMGTLAEEGTADEEVSLQKEFIDLTATAATDPWGVVEVDVTGTLPAAEDSPVYLVAACFDRYTWQMVDSSYMEVTDGESVGYTLYLYDTPEDGEVYVFALDQGLESLTMNGVEADWVEYEYALDGQEELIEETTVPEETVETEPEETEETVPETTEETVPETTEETAPETTEESIPAQEPEGELTPEGAAEEGYYVAPEGATLEESAALEEMAAFIGTDKTSKDLHTASFTGLAPQQAYTFLVSGTPGSLDDLKYIWLAASDANGDYSTSYRPKDEAAAIVQLYGPEKLTLTVDQEYVTLQPGQNVQLRLSSNRTLTEVRPSYDENTAEALNVYVDGEDNTLFGVNIKDDFLGKLREVESRYITFQAYDELRQEATVKVRVDLIPEDSRINGAALGETAITHNYYSTEATPIPVFLDIKTPEQEPVEGGVDTLAAFDGAENSGLILCAAFAEGTDPVLEEAFEIRVQDDHTLLLVTKETGETAEYASDGPNIDFSPVVNRLKSSYNVGLVLTVNDRGEEVGLNVTGTLKLNVQKKLPTLKAETVTLNTYAQPTGIVTITGGEVEALKCKGTDLVTLEYDGESGTVTAWLKESTTRSTTVSLTAEAVVKGYNQPVTVKVPVKIDAKAPSFKLGTTTWNLCSIGYQYTWIPIQCTTKGIELANLDFGEIEIYDAKGKSLKGIYTAEMEGDTLFVTALRQSDYDENGEEYEVGRTAGRTSLTLKTNILCGDIKTPITWKLTVNNQEPTLKLNKTSLVLNPNVAAGAAVKATITGWPDEETCFLDFRVVGKKFGEATQYFYLDTDGGDGLTLSVNSSALGALVGDPVETFLRDTYTVSIGIVGVEESRWAKLTMKLSDGEFQMTGLRASGTIDLNNDDSYVTLTPTFSGKLSVGSLEVTVKDAEGIKRTFDAVMDGDKVLISRNMDEKTLKPGTYTAEVTAYWGNNPISRTAAFKVIEKKPTVKVTGRLDSGKGTGITVAASYKHYVEDESQGYRLEEPTVTLTTAGKEPQDVSKELYTYWTDWNDGTVMIYPQTYDVKELLPAGKYTLTLTYGKGENALELSTPITVTQTAPTLKIYKSSLTLHPGYRGEIWFPSSYTGVTGNANVQIYQADGKTPWSGDDLVEVEFKPDDHISVKVVGEAPEKDTTLKVKLIPDTRISGKFTWLTVKVLGGKSLNRTAALKVLGSPDPSYSYSYVGIQVTHKGIDNPFFEDGTAVLQESTDKGRTYTNVTFAHQFNVEHGFVRLDIFGSGLNPNNKYRVRVSYADGAITGTVDLKVAYGKNKFTVAQAPTLYKKDYQAEMDIHIDQQDMEQQIDRIDLKTGTGFEIEKAAGENDWTLRYIGTQAKLKTTTLPLQIFLKGNETTKPNATLNLKVTVK